MADIYVWLLAIVLNISAYILFRNLEALFIVVMSIGFLSVELWIQRRNKDRAIKQQIKEEVGFPKMLTCKYYSHDIHLKCAVNPRAPCSECRSYESGLDKN